MTTEEIKAEIMRLVDTLPANVLPELLNFIKELKKGVPTTKRSKI
jgi:hypothetical protein